MHTFMIEKIVEVTTGYQVEAKTEEEAIKIVRRFGDEKPQHEKILWKDQQMFWTPRYRTY